MKRYRLSVALFSLLAALFLMNSGEVKAAADGFATENGNTYYYENGQKLTGWKYVEEDGSWYYFAPGSGLMLKDDWFWLTDVNGNGSWERLNSKGQAIDQILEMNGNTYYSYAGPEKGYHRGWLEANGFSYYYRTGSGSRVSGWQYIDGSWRYFRSSGTMVEDGWAWLPISSSKSVWKYFNSLGENIDQFRTENNMTVLSQIGPGTDYFRGWWDDPENGQTYYFRLSSGTRVSSWQYIENNWHYFRVPSGTQAFGLQYIDGFWYYLDPVYGHRMTGWQKVDGEDKFFKSNGQYDPNAKQVSASGYPIAAGSEQIYSIDRFEWMGIISWGGKTFSYYSERVLPGYGLRIPGRYTADGFVRDGDGYIVLASDYYEKGTIISTPFGADGKVYDRLGTGQPSYRFDVYTR